MTILITGSSGKTSSRLANILRPTHSLLIASRSGASVKDSPGVVFDWNNAATHENPFAHAQHQHSAIRVVYLVAPSAEMDVLPVMSAFIETARKRGVKRFVLLSASPIDETGPSTGAVHKYLQGLEKEGVEWAVLRPSWFMENFSEAGHCVTIRDHSKIYTATGDGRVPFISADDIAAVAAQCLTTATPPNCDYLVLGPKLHSYDDVAAIFTDVLGRPITHDKQTTERMSALFQQLAGIAPSYADMLAGLDASIAQGSEDRHNDVVLQVTGKAPISMRDFIEKNKAVWVI